MSTEAIKIIEDVKANDLKKLKGEWSRLGKGPTPGCKGCHGRGYTGYNLTTGKYVVCRCVKKGSVKEDSK